jgi:glycosidase
MDFRRISDIDLGQMVRDHNAGGKRYFASPNHWEDEALYFLLADRFSDDKENDYFDAKGNHVTSGTTPRFAAADNGNAVGSPGESKSWRDAGQVFVGGKLKGVESKLGYLRRMGVTAIWLSPIFKQVKADNTYHGYGIQNFLNVDPNFGTRNDLRDLVNAAHENGIRVVLDIILNHTGQVFLYNPDRYDTVDQNGEHFNDPRWDGSPYKVAGYRDGTGAASLAFATVNTGGAPAPFDEAAVWPAEFQDPGNFTQLGRISNFDYFPEFLDGDFFTLKDLRHGTRVLKNGQDQIDDYAVSATLKFLGEVYKFWIAFADIDGFRVDTVKHMDPGATRFFAGAIHEFAESVGKDNFYLIAEITGGRTRAYDTQETTGVDAVLGIDDVQDKLEFLVKGLRNAAEYFDLFRNSLLVRKDSHVWFRDKVVTMTDDHDQVRKGANKARFCATDRGQDLLVAMLGLNTCTMGIPCIYYGTEQGFDGQGSGDGADRYIREAMFGGKFGAFRSKGRHFFDEQTAGYRELSKILALRNTEAALRRGRQFLREISGDGFNFGLPQMIGNQMRSVVPWSRIFADQELVCAINSDPDSSRSAWVTIDDSLHKVGEKLTCRYSSDSAQIGSIASTEARNGKAVKLTVPKGGFVVFK